MIRVTNNFAKAMEFTSFKKKEKATDDELMNAVLKFEVALAKQNGIIFHCLVRNLKNEYANVLFVENLENLHSLVKEVSSLPEAKDFFEQIEMASVKMHLHEILKEDFKIPEGFSCIEHGTFMLKETTSFDDLAIASQRLESGYLNAFDNHLGHFVGKVSDKKGSEIAIGKTYAKTKQECYGYFHNSFGQQFLSLADIDTADLDFWYVIA